MYYIKQIKEDDCGFTCLKILLAKHYKNKEYLFIPNEKEQGAYSYKELISIGQNYGVKLNGIKVKDKNEIINNRDFPLIITIKKDEINHAVILEKIAKKEACIFDPIKGKRKILIDELISIWDGSALLIKEEIEQIKYPIPLVLFDKKEKAMSHILQIMASIFCIIGIYFLGDEKTNIVPLMFMVLFIIFEIFSRLNSIRIMKKMDSSFLEIIDNHNYKNQDLLFNYENYKKDELTGRLNIVFSLLITIFIIIVILINGLSNLIFVGITMIVALIKHYILDKIITNKTDVVNKQEIDILNTKNIEEYKITFDNLHKVSYKIGITSLLSRFSCIGIILLSVFATMIINNLSSATFLVFYSTFSIYLFEQLNNVLKAHNIIDEYYQNKCKLINSLTNYSQKDR